jgi:hypothetical protein
LPLWKPSCTFAGAVGATLFVGAGVVTERTLLCETFPKLSRASTRSSCVAEGVRAKTFANLHGRLLRCGVPSRYTV